MWMCLGRSHRRKSTASRWHFLDADAASPHWYTDNLPTSVCSGSTYRHRRSHQTPYREFEHMNSAVWSHSVSPAISQSAGDGDSAMGPLGAVHTVCPAMHRLFSQSRHSMLHHGFFPYPLLLPADHSLRYLCVQQRHRPEPSNITRDEKKRVEWKKKTWANCNMDWRWRKKICLYHQFFTPTHSEGEQFNLQLEQNGVECKLTG